MDTNANKEDVVYTFAKHVVGTTYEDLPPEVVESTKVSILTHLGTALAGSTVVPVCRQLAELAEEMGGKKESTILGFGTKVPSHMASFVNASLAHGLNFGDTDDETGLHTGIAALSPALAMAERVGGVSGKQLITAFTLGTDIMIRLGRAISGEKARNWPAYGWWQGQILGYTPAAVVAAKVLGLDETKTLRAMGLAYAQTAGSIDSIKGAGADKAMYAAYPALGGALAALMAQKGIAGPKESLEGKAGLFKVYFQGEYDPTPLTADLGKDFAGACVGFAAYPSSALTHAYIDAALALVKEGGIQPDDVESVMLTIGTEEQSFGTCEPLEVRRNPTKMAETQVSLPFSVGAAIAKGTPRLDDFANGFKDAAILKVSNKVSYKFDVAYGHRQGSPVYRPGVEVRMADGRVLRADQDTYRRGSLNNPMTMEEHVGKFKDCAAFSVNPLSSSSIKHVVEMLANLEEVADVSEIIRACSPA